MHKNSIIKFDEVSYKINKRYINQNLCFSIKSGQLVSIIGPNGSGKSTMLKLMSGEIAPTLGSVYFKNTNISKMDIHYISRFRAVLSQSNNLSFP